MSDIVKALTKQFADKADTRKALKIHEKQFQNLYNLIMSKNGGENEEDAMFSKKPLGGLSCASCEKGLIDMHGKRVEFMDLGQQAAGSQRINFDVSNLEAGMYQYTLTVGGETATRKMLVK